MSKSNYDHLRDILQDLKDNQWGVDPANGQIEEALEFLENIEQDQLDKIEQLSTELDDAKQEINSAKEDLDDTMKDYHTIDLGLDTMYVKLEKGNLRITSQLEAWVNQVKKQNCAGVEMTESLF